MAAVAVAQQDCPPQHAVDQEEATATKPSPLAKMDSSSALEGVVSSTQPVTVSESLMAHCHGGRVAA
jgi:hypothetical protein